MRKLALALVGAAGLTLFPAAANAAVTIIHPNTVVNPTAGQTITFFTSGNIFSGPIAAQFGDTGIPTGSFTDNYVFTIPQNGTGSGSVTTTVSVAGVGGVNDLDFTSVTVNGLPATPVYRDAGGAICTTPGVGTCGATETFAINDVPITSGVQNTISISGTSRGNGSYGGNATFIPSVPEPSTWAMMILGFGIVGFGMRHSRRPKLLAQAA
jgi:hypothetical protein